MKQRFEAYVLERMPEWVRAACDGEDPERLAAELARTDFQEHQVDQLQELITVLVELAEQVEDEGGGAAAVGDAVMAIEALGFDPAIGTKLMAAARSGVRRARGQA